MEMVQSGSSVVKTGKFALLSTFIGIWIPMGVGVDDVQQASAGQQQDMTYELHFT